MATKAMTIVSLDTEVFVRQNFQYDAGLLAAFRQHVRTGRATHVITDVTLNEVRARIVQAVDDAIRASTVFSKNARILRNSHPFKGVLFKKLSRRKLIEELHAQLDAYLTDLHSVVVPIDDVAPSSVLSRYFDQRPPFGVVSRKKAEFPDAFAIEALRLYARERACRVTVVSADSDWEAALQEVDELDHVEQLESLLEALQAGTPLLEPATRAVKELEGEIAARARDALQGVTFVVVDRSASVENVEPLNSRVRSTFVADASDDTLTFSADVEISAEVFVAYHDTPPNVWPLPSDLDAYGPYGPFHAAEGPDSLHSWEAYRVVGTASWNPENPGTEALTELAILDPLVVPLYFRDLYSGS